MPVPVPAGGAVGLRTEVEFRLQGGEELVEVRGHAVGPGGQGLLAGRLVQIKCKIFSIQYIWRKLVHIMRYNLSREKHIHDRHT